MATLRNTLRERGNHELKQEPEAEELYAKCSNIAYKSMCQMKARYADNISENEKEKKFPPTSASSSSTRASSQSLLKHGIEMMKRLIVSSQNNLANLAVSCGRHIKARKCYR